ncbi:hypothetical protein D3C74_189650 [compost metagenome]
MSEPADKEALIASLQEQLRQAVYCAAHWTCLYHADANRFQKQNKEIGRLQAERKQLMSNIEKRISDQLRWGTPTGNEVAKELRAIRNDLKAGEPDARQGTQNRNMDT